MSSPWVPANSAWVNRLPSWLFPNAFRILAKVTETQDNGEELDTGERTVIASGRCRKAQVVLDRPQTAEYRQSHEDANDEEFHVLLQGYWSTIQEYHTAEVDGVEYNTIGIEPNAEQTMMRLRVERVTTS